MSTDTRPSVTVVGELSVDCLGGVQVDLDDLPDIGLKDGDEVEVTIRKHERLPANPWAAPRKTEGD